MDGGRYHHDTDPTDVHLGLSTVSRDQTHTIGDGAGRTQENAVPRAGLATRSVCRQSNAFRSQQALSGLTAVQIDREAPPSQDEGDVCVWRALPPASDLLSRRHRGLKILPGHQRALRSGTAWDDVIPKRQALKRSRQEWIRWHSDVLVNGANWIRTRRPPARCRGSSHPASLSLSSWVSPLASRFVERRVGCTVPACPGTPCALGPSLFARGWTATSCSLMLPNRRPRRSARRRVPYASLPSEALDLLARKQANSVRSLHCQQPPRTLPYTNGVGRYVECSGYFTCVRRSESRPVGRSESRPPEGCSFYARLI